VQISFGKWFLVASAPALTAIVLLPRVVARLFPPGVGKTPEAPVAARKELAALGRSRATSGSPRWRSCSWSRLDLRGCAEAQRDRSPSPGSACC